MNKFKVGQMCRVVRCRDKNDESLLSQIGKSGVVTKVEKNSGEGSLYHLQGVKECWFADELKLNADYIGEWE
jgi:hypothetical protein